MFKVKMYCSKVVRQLNKVGVVLFLLAGIALNAYAANKTINIQGKLVDNSGNPITGYHNLQFMFYDALTGGSELITEILCTGVSLGTIGLFNVTLGENGELNNLPFNQQYYVAIRIDSESYMSPRQIISPSGYALGSLGDFNAAGNLGGISLSVIGGTASGRIGTIESSGSQTKFYVKNTDSGDPVSVWELPGTRAWMAGIDNSDSDKWKLASAEDEPWANTVLTATTDGKIGIGTTNPGSNLEIFADNATLTKNLLTVKGGGSGGPGYGFSVEANNGDSLLKVDNYYYRVGIYKSNPGYLLDMEPSGGGYYSSGDHQWHNGACYEKYKANIINYDIPNVLTALDNVNLRKYQYKDYIKETQQWEIPISTKPYVYGYVYDELPDTLKESVVGENGGLTMNGLFVYITSIAKAQQKIINDQKIEIKNLQAQIDKLNK
ncbi:MAG: hypothetical protein A2252_05310 [Elusimicrobia bacterium RIFOXYA2_FULL_39_19]|nr:MAG: hypothetical protein A2252_05310 [Elusimicrobia bacterium RIFOXYA2_FULL_39_19]